MSDGHEPNLTDVMAAIQGLQEVVIGQDGKLTGLSQHVDALSGRMDRLEAAVSRYDERLTELRVVAMERIDRLQSTMDQMRDDQGVLLGLLETNQKLAERSMTEARFASEQHSSLAHTVTLIEMQVRKLRADVDELRARK
jgi:phage shock protein A